jgi:hypothetical protein
MDIMWHFMYVKGHEPAFQKYPRVDEDLPSNSVADQNLLLYREIWGSIMR